jgi:hypothetical protein
MFSGAPLAALELLAGLEEIDDDRTRALRAISESPALTVLGRTSEAIAVAVALNEIRSPVKVGVYRRRVEVRVPCLDRVWHTVAVRVVIQRVHGSIFIRIYWETDGQENIEEILKIKITDIDTIHRTLKIGNRIYTLHPYTIGMIKEFAEADYCHLKGKEGNTPSLPQKVIMVIFLEQF